MVTEEQLSEAVKKEQGNSELLKENPSEDSRWQVLVEQKRLPALNGDGK